MKRLACLVLLSIAFVACKTPTELSIELRSDIGYRSDMVVAVSVGPPETIESAPPNVVIRSPWVAGGSLGDVVAVPSGERDDLAVRIVLATGKDPSACSAVDATGCVVVRRRLRFSRGASTSALLVLRPACLGVYCDAGSSCAVDGTCGSLTSDEATRDGGADPVVAVAGADAYAAAVIADRPRHYYRLDEPTGATIARDAMGRADGVIDAAHVELGATGALASSTNPAAFFDGSGAIVVVNADSANGAATVEAWFRSDSSDDLVRTVVERVDVVAASQYGFRLAKPNDSSATFSVFRGDRAFETSAPATRFAGFSHVVAVTRGTSIELYVNGAKADPALLVASATALLGPLVIGGSRVGNAGFLGAIDEVAVSDYPLDREQIWRHYDVGSR